jgi:5-dehydro-4-deoxyglucarate dehydratase
MTDAALAARLHGPMFFPVTAFDRRGAVDLDVLRTHLRTGIEAGAGAVFVCCGTGEFHALTPEEYGACVAAAVRVADGALPVVAGTGYGTALAADFARRAEAAGADGLLVLPPYLVQAGQRGLLRHYTELAAATGLELIVYQRDNAVFTPQTVAELARTPGIAGLKDGLGDLELLQRIISTVREAGADGGFRYLNGLPTAELTAGAYRGLGVELYSSAVFCFAPEIATAFRAALGGTGTGDPELLRELIDGFYRPLAELRDRGRGYPVSLVKAGVRLRGLDVGTVRAPLAEPEPADIADLELLIKHGLRLVGA